MNDSLRKIFFAVLPLAGLLCGTSPAFAHDDWRHERFHDRLGEVHEEFHEHPYSRGEHRRFHRWLNQEHGDFHYDRDDWPRHYHNRDWQWDRRYDGRWDRSNWYSDRSFGDDWRPRGRHASCRPRYDRAWYGNERSSYGDDGYAPFRYASPSYSSSPWWSVFLDR